MTTNEQNNGTVTLDGKLKQLPIMLAWNNSSSVYWVVPEYPASEMYFKVGSADGKSWAVVVKMHCHPKRGRFRAYIPGKYFAGGRYETRYQIVTVDEEGSKHISGEGILRVFDSPIREFEREQIVACALWPDGVVREITITEDDVGAPIFRIGDKETGKEIAQGAIYAHNNSNGLFHLVTPFYDDTNEPMLRVSEDPVNGGYEQFVVDESGFYRRIECGTDESGTTNLKTGDSLV